MTQARFKNLATPTEKVCFPRGGRQIGVPGRKTRPNGSPEGSGAIGPAARRTDTKSLVSVAVSQGLIRSATHSATDQQLTPAESAGNAKVAKEGEGVSNVAGGGNRKSGSAEEKKLPNDVGQKDADSCAPETSAATQSDVPAPSSTAKATLTLPAPNHEAH